MSYLATRPPQGVVTLLFTDVEGSTKRWEQFGERFGEALQIHDRLVRAAIARWNGFEVKTVGDAFMVAFENAADAVRCALDIQRALVDAGQDQPVWNEVGGIRVRIGIHTGEPSLRDNDYFGPPVNRAARICDAGHGGMTVLSDYTARRAMQEAGEVFALEDCGLHTLKDLGEKQRLFLLKDPTLPEVPHKPLRTLEAVAHNFPAQVTSFIGRKREIDDLTRLLRTHGARLITLTGPGGTGKTRLAMQVAANQLQDFPGGVWMVDLCNVRDYQAVPAAIALALKIELTADADPRQRVVEFLQPRRCLLLLDNFEQVADAARFLGDVLRECPTLTCLVTSRELLHLSGEHEYPVEPLAVPPPNKRDNHWIQYESVELFVERCRSARSDFALTDDMAPTVGEICRRLDGIPLALELAAARIRGMTPSQVLQRLSRRLDLLASSQRDLPERQRTLRGAIDWSYDLLTEDERALFAEMAVFTAGFFLEAAEEVCLTPGAFDLVFSLRDKSLLKTDEVNGEVRYYMLDMLRDYALEKLETAGTLPELRDRHAAYYLARAQTWQAKLDKTGSDVTEAMEVFTVDIENMRAGMEWAVEKNDTGLTIDYGKALARFLLARGLYIECDQRLQPAEQAARDSGDREALAVLLNQRGRAAWRRSDLETARTCYSESYAIAEELGNRQRTVPPLINLGNILWACSEYDEARQVWEKALQIAIELGDPFYQARLKDHLGILETLRGDYAAAEQHFEDAIAAQKRSKDEVGLAFTLLGSADLYSERKDYDGAMNRLAECHRLFTALGQQLGLAAALISMAKNLLERGDTASARTRVEEGMKIAREIGDKRWEMQALDVMGRIATEEGRYDDARRLLRSACNLAGELRDRKVAIDITRHFGDLLRRAGDLEKAYLILAYTQKEYANLGHPKAAEVAEGLAELHKELGDTATARLNEAAASLAPEDVIARFE